MQPVLIVAIVFGGIVMIVAIISSTILMAIKVRKEGVTSKKRQTQTDEAKIIQEIYQGISRMEERVDALETIISDYQRKDR